VTLENAIAKAQAANAERLSAGIPRVSEPLTPTELEHLAPWNRFNSFHGTRPIPANPRVICAFIKEVSRDVGPLQIIDTLLAIERLHNLHSLPNPIATSVVRDQWARLVKVDSPRSWTKDEQLFFATVLPVEIQAAVSRREKSREIEVRRLQNDAALFRKAAAAKKAEEAELFRLMATEFSTAVTSSEKVENHDNQKTQ
jgi:hypothetical protein